MHPGKRGRVENGPVQWAKENKVSSEAVAETAQRRYFRSTCVRGQNRPHQSGIEREKEQEEDVDLWGDSEEGGAGRNQKKNKDLFWWKTGNRTNASIREEGIEQQGVSARTRMKARTQYKRSILERKA